MSKKIINLDKYKIDKNQQIKQNNHRKDITDFTDNEQLFKRLRQEKRKEKGIKWE